MAKVYPQVDRKTLIDLRTEVSMETNERAMPHNAHKLLTGITQKQRKNSSSGRGNHPASRKNLKQWKKGCPSPNQQKGYLQDDRITVFHIDNDHGRLRGIEPDRRRLRVEVNHPAFCFHFRFPSHYFTMRSSLASFADNISDICS